MSKKKYLIILVLIALVAQMLVTGNNYAKAEENIEYIESENDLWNLQNYISEGGATLGKKYIQTKNIVMTKENWPGLGDTLDQFEGFYDGGGFSISNISINASHDKSGFINCLGKSGLVSNLSLTNLSINADKYDFIGGIAGESCGQIDNCKVEARLTGYGRIYGGIAGKASNTTDVAVKNCVVKKNSLIQAGENAGGICGNLTGNIASCCNEGQVYSVENGSTGGIVGILRGDARCCENYGLVCSDFSKSFIYAQAGGIAGSATGNFYQCNNFGKIFSRRLAGGIVANTHDVEVLNCTNNGNIEIIPVKNGEPDSYNEYLAGGIIGTAQKDIYIIGCINQGEITSPFGYTGGIFGAVDNGLVNGEMVEAERYLYANYVKPGTLINTDVQTQAFYGSLVGYGKKMRISKCVVNSDSQLPFCGTEDTVKKIECQQHIITLDKLSETASALNQSMAEFSDRQLEEISKFLVYDENIIIEKDDRILPLEEVFEYVDVTRMPLATVAPTVIPTAPTTSAPIAQTSAPNTSAPTEEASVLITSTPITSTPTTNTPTISVPTKDATVPTASASVTIAPTATATGAPTAVPTANNDKPIAVKNIKGKLVKDGFKLSWKCNEKNVSFLIYKSKTGKNYKKICTVKNTNYLDKSATPGINYYRIQVLDAGGKKSDYSIKKFDIPWIIQPDFKLSKIRNKTGGILKIILLNFQKKKVEIWLQGKNNKFTKIKLNNSQQSKKIYRMKYSKAGVSVNCRVRYYAKIKGKKRYSAFSKVKSIKL